MTNSTVPAHAHAWSSMRFELLDGHPWVLETCATCGAGRRYRAFERTWDPATAGGPDRQRDLRRTTAGAAGAQPATDD